MTDISRQSPTTLTTSYHCDRHLPPKADDVTDVSSLSLTSPTKGRRRYRRLITVADISRQRPTKLKTSQHCRRHLPPKTDVSSLSQTSPAKYRRLITVADISSQRYHGPVLVRSQIDSYRRPADSASFN